MTQLYIVEIQQNQAGEFSHNVYWAWDENSAVAQQKGESKYYEVLSAAAVSEAPSHAVILFSAEGVPLLNKCYKHVEETPPAPHEDEVLPEA